MRDAPELRERASELCGRKCGRVRLVEDTSLFMELETGDVLDLQGRRFVVTGTEYEGRFGLVRAAQVPWVKRAMDWEDGSRQDHQAGVPRRVLPTWPWEGFKVRCYRSPEKEARILALVHGDAQLHAGRSPSATRRATQVRVLDRIPRRARWICK